MTYAESGAYRFTAAEIRALLYAVRDLVARADLGIRPPLPGEFDALRTRLAGFVCETKTCVTQPDSAPSATEELIDTNEAAQILRCTPQWVGRIRDRLGVREIGSHRVFPRQTVVQYAQRKAGHHK